ncbi:hypothetical protein WR25_07374 [Diploscapter pachys]|uniref:Uncharacterized protein n=1 Tax=Diploscapter pachys TaxID=2018661 RepID=A0A2A2K779_9BILA|nr:hypothetical protein WR25_07374 [Diploscapter pachys]
MATAPWLPAITPLTWICTCRGISANHRPAAVSATTGASAARAVACPAAGGHNSCPQVASPAMATSNPSACNNSPSDKLGRTIRMVTRSLCACAQAYRPLRWQSDRDGYRFVRADGQVLAEGPLKPRRWQAETVKVQAEPRGAVWLDGEWIGAPLTLRLHSGTLRLELARNAAGQVRVSQP